MEEKNVVKLNFHPMEDIVKRMKRHVRLKKKKIFAKPMSDKGLVPQIYKKLLTVDNKHILKIGEKHPDTSPKTIYRCQINI